MEADLHLLSPPFSIFVSAKVGDSQLFLRKLKI